MNNAERGARFRVVDKAVEALSRRCGVPHDPDHAPKGHQDTMSQAAETFATAAAASAQIDAERIETLRDFEQMLPCDLTDEERDDKVQHLVTAHDAIEQRERELAEETARHKAEKDRIAEDLTVARGQASQLAKQIRLSRHDKLVACREEKVFATGIVRTVRLDTGETVSERAMQAYERQASLGLDGGDEGSEEEERDPDAPTSYSDLADSAPPSAADIDDPAAMLEQMPEPEQPKKRGRGRK